MQLLNPAVNLEFNAHFLDTALDSGERVVECPITFHPRVGVRQRRQHQQPESPSCGSADDLRTLFRLAQGPELSSSIPMRFSSTDPDYQPGVVGW
jgi:hypothetical protein